MLPSVLESEERVHELIPVGWLGSHFEMGCLDAQIHVAKKRPFWDAMLRNVCSLCKTVSQDMISLLVSAEGSVIY